MPCDGLSAYADSRVVKTSNAKAAPVGDSIDLWEFCGYAAYTPSLPCLSQNKRAASTAAQARCYLAATRAQNTRIAKSERSPANFIYEGAQDQSQIDDHDLMTNRNDDRVAKQARTAFEAGERAWREYRQGFCTSNFDSPQESPNVVYDACLYHLDEAQLHALNA